ncbi:TonB-dependent receptor [Gallaecimonas sp. GXIMD4217]|uniref:TonB-dependent receptor plug domain-containing protein n=1 Tax=Gallaecimonas sp. GXIMD4217 TaxID=3131927 RepID=UPI00311B3041
MYRNKVANSVRWALLAGAATTAFAMPAAFAADEGAEDVERIEVTGSRIKRTDLEGASPVVVISSEDIEAGGYNSVQEVLGSLTQNSGGSLSTQEIHGFTPAASGVNLRGAGLGRVLILIDGKRVPKYPFGAGGTDNFIDTANMPLGAIERIDVLTSGASAIYGSDAMGGVINIILKKDFEGVATKVRASDTDAGGKEQFQASLLVGAASDKGNVTFFLEHDNKSRLKASERDNFDVGTDLAFNHPFSSFSSYGISLRNAGSTVLQTLSPEECEERGLQFWDYGRSNVGGVCGFDRTSMRDLYPASERTSAMVKFNYNLSDDHELYGRLDWTNASSTTRIEPMPVNDYTYVVAGDEVTISSDLSGESKTFDKATAFGGDFASLGDGEYFYTRRMMEFGHRRADFTTNNFSFVSGVQGLLTEDIDYDFSWQFSRQKIDERNSGYASAGLYFEYLTSGENGRSQFDVMTAEEVAQAAYKPFRAGESSLTGFSFDISGLLFDLPAGEVGFAAGAEYYREWFSDESDSESAKNNILSTGGASGSGARDQKAIYAEVEIPVLENLTFNVAGRYDDYSDFGGEFSPQLTLSYRPIDDLLLRALWTETFRAPDMMRVYGDPSLGFSQVTDPFACTQIGGTVGDPDGDPVCSGEHYVEVLTGPNPDLDPEVGENWNIGAVYTLATDIGEFDFSIDYWEMEIEDIVNDLATQTILTNFETYNELIERDAIGQAVRVNNTAQNVSFRETAGIDLTVGYRKGTDLGDFSVNVTGSYLDKWDEQFDVNSDVVDQLSTTNVPEWKINTNLGWSYDKFAANILIRYTDEMNGVNASDFEDVSHEDFPFSRKIDSYTLVNLSMNYYATENLSFQIGVNNVFDEGPNVDYTDFGWPHYPREYTDPTGREYYGVVEYQF